MTMTVGDLRAMIEDLDGEREVRLVFQESWPLQFALHGVVDEPNDAADGDFCEECAGDMPCVDADCACTCHAEQPADTRVYLIAEDGSPRQDPYGRKSWWDTARRF